MISKHENPYLGLSKVLTVLLRADPKPDDIFAPRSKVFRKLPRVFHLLQHTPLTHLQVQPLELSNLCCHPVLSKFEHFVLKLFGKVVVEMIVGGQPGFQLLTGFLGESRLFRCFPGVQLQTERQNCYYTKTKTEKDPKCAILRISNKILRGGVATKSESLHHQRISNIIRISKIRKISRINRGLPASK